MVSDMMLCMYLLVLCPSILLMVLLASTTSTCKLYLNARGDSLRITLAGSVWILQKKMNKRDALIRLFRWRPVGSCSLGSYPLVLMLGHDWS